MRFVIRLALLVLMTGSPAFADTTPARVSLPYGLETSDSSATNANHQDHEYLDHEYLTIGALRIVKPSRLL